MIEINNLTTNEVDEDFLKGVAKKVLKGENKEEKELSIVFVGEGRMRKLNKKYQKKNKVTDVLAFGKDKKSKIKNQKFLIFPRNETELGEVVICLREVKKNAKRFDSTSEKELARVLIHGILHLLGYEHEKDGEEAKEMQKKQETYLSQVLKS